ncbi:intercompartmental signaling factor BofC [Halobacillus litoralis]|uniref:BofC C-terminal domain-containing protein n=1 Tax=Halobacillus litoralis TaxID=45668 RepID=UPI001CD5EB7F|nr:BofC C-terminal domain-containing protein [Halobacillus litoralis]MCA0969955.1 intercompartmental signaling factor BofC [Halobacillus litoralis]
MLRLVGTILLLLTVVGCQEGMESNDLPFAQKGQVERSMIPSSEKVNAVSSRVNAEPLELTVELNKHYLDGVTETTKIQETIWSMMDFWAEYEQWTIESQELERIVFSRQVEDISPLTKKQGYFGLTDNGEIAVFRGMPGNGEVIESFKPIPVKPLESKRRQELEKGIKIQDFRHFQQVLEQLSTKEPV